MLGARFFYQLTEAPWGFTVVSSLVALELPHVVDMELLEAGDDLTHYRTSKGLALARIWEIWDERMKANSSHAQT